MCQEQAWEYERAYFKSSKGKAAQKKYRQTPRGRALQKEYVRAYLASAKGKAAMKEVPAIRQGQAASRTARKKWLESPKGRATSRRYGSATRNTRRLIENPPGPGTACDPAWENKACRANKTVWFLLPRSSPICPVLGLAIGPSQHSFTIADQVNQLVRASDADPDLGFMARTIALCSLPGTTPGNRLQYKRVNGPFTPPS